MTGYAMERLVISVRAGKVMICLFHHRQFGYENIIVLTEFPNFITLISTITELALIQKYCVGIYSFWWDWKMLGEWPTFAEKKSFL